ncbi:MAG TPA: sigma 54-interacting transcriptional regulator [Candidatus Dormibacteraeota bacterium]|jgi:DNA-binding NtrC family response regulator|nr:sigma 54-interacting transcriptional regulator [Candidatus Dormibacteraeota bacterium]
MNILHKTEHAHDPLTSGFVYGASEAIRSLNNAVSEIAPTDIPVLIVGESGTGKDAYARLIHRLSHRHESAFCKVNCAAFDLGQVSRHFRLSDNPSSLALSGGTLYLDNVQELDMASQRVLLSSLPEDGGMDSTDDVAVRLISSTSINLESEVEAGRFRRELYFRLNGACLRLPSLHERSEDVPAFADHFLDKHSHLLKKRAPALTEDVVHSLSTFRWPGNIRELENLARKMVVFGDSKIPLKDLDFSGTQKPSIKVSTQVTSLKVAARAASVKAERELIMQALERTHWNRKRAARELQISYKSLLYKIKQIGVSTEKHES